MWLHRYRTSLCFAATVSQIANEFLTCVKLCARRLVSIEIAHETNAERDVVQIIAVHMTAVDLTSPAIADFDFSVTGGGAVADDEVVSESVVHPSDISVVVIEDAGVALPGTAVVHDDKAPAVTQHRGAVYLAAHGIGEVFVAFPEKVEWKGKTAWLLVSRLLDDDFGGLGVT